jgi:hypothetical protein
MPSSDSEKSDKSNTPKKQDSDSDQSDSDTSQKPETTQKQFMDKIKEYIKVDDLIKQNKKLLKEREELGDFLSKYFEKKKLESVNSGDYVIKRVTKNKKEPLDKKNLKTNLIGGLKKEGYVKSDGSVKGDGEKVVQYVLDVLQDRPVSKTYTLECHKKGEEKTKKTK